MVWAEPFLFAQFIVPYPASDGAENAIDHAVASFLVFWGIEKAELRKEAPPILIN